MISQHAPLATRFAHHLPSLPAARFTSDWDESELVAASRRGDAEAYGSLVRKYQDRLCASLGYICGSRADAQDAAQEAFLRAYLKLGTYTGASAFYTWLYRIAVNIVISQKRKQKTRSACEQSRPLGAGAREEQSDGPDERLLRTEQIEQVQNALNSLAPLQRTILVLREIDKRDYGEIASILGIPLGTVRSRLHRARLELREKLCQLTGSE